MPSPFPRRARRQVASSHPPSLLRLWAAPGRDVVSASNDQSATTGYYQPVLRFLRQEAAASGPPFRTEIPFTRFHWEAWVVAAHFPLARGWERQLDIADNPLFYRDNTMMVLGDAKKMTEEIAKAL